MQQELKMLKQQALDEAAATAAEAERQNRALREELDATTQRMLEAEDRERRMQQALDEAGARCEQAESALQATKEELTLVRGVRYSEHIVSQY